jgi:hypothetical protein
MLAAACGLLAAPSIARAQGAGHGVALVIGNSKYKWETSLPNVRRDAPDIARAFQALGLKTELLQDAGHDAMRAAVDKFAASARDANLAAFYFAGHGAAWDKDTYLVPEDADLANPSTVQSFVSARSINEASRQARHRLLVFDNCRNNPADGWRQRAAAISSSVARTELAGAALNGPNTLVLFSTAPGRVALDGPAGENSPFAAALLRELASPPVDLRALPEKLRRGLLIATGGRQVLWDQNSYDQPFLLAGSTARPAAASARPTGSLQVVDLPNAYAFARDKGLLLPPGLVALRPAAGPAEGPTVGAYQSTIKVMVGSVIPSPNSTIEALLLVVLSISEKGSAQIIVSTKDWLSRGGQSPVGPFWRFTTAKVEGTRLEFKLLGLANTMAENPQTFKWSDVNSGRFSGRPDQGTVYAAPFTRLDG